jgi:phosphate transport system substrate-binding protein
MKLRSWPAVRTFVALAVVLLAVSLAAVGCGKEPACTITEAGSTTVEPVAEQLEDEYMQKHSCVRVIAGGGGTAVGVTSPRV